MERTVVPPAPPVAPHGGGTQRSSRMFFHRFLRISTAAGSKSGAITTSANPSMICSAIASVTALLAATTPP